MSLRERADQEPLEIVVFAASDEPLVVALPREGRLVLGRDPSCDVRINDESVSRRHATLHLGRPLYVEDLGSSNGTFVRHEGGRPAAAETRKVHRARGEKLAVEPGESVVLGSVVVILRRAKKRPSNRPARSSSPSRVVVHDPKMLALHEQVRVVAKAEVPVLILGETGVGKEVLARAIHEASSRAAKPFVAINCAAFSESLIESELFGHNKGSFTGATEDKKGFIEEAHGGTLFLDEIGELPDKVQAKLLRVLDDERAVTRIGERASRPVDVRFIAATNRDLRADVASGRFRKDLFFRLNGEELLVPPLRERRAEILPLASAFLEEACPELERASVPAIGAEVAKILENHAWEGNVRELRRVMQRAAAFCSGDVVLPKHLPAHLLGGAKEAPPPRESSPLATLRVPQDKGLSEAQLEERRKILEALDKFAGNQTSAAAFLGMPRRTFVLRLDEYGIPRPRKKS